MAIFVHGFRGNYLTTWGDLPTLLRDGSDSRAPFSSWDYLFLGYDTRKVSTYLDIAARIFTYWQLAAAGNDPFRHAYTRLALFGHSLGTLGIRQALTAWSVQPANMLKAVHSVTLFGTPLNGSPWAGAALNYRIRHALKPRNEQFQMLKVWNDSAILERGWPKIQLVLGQDDSVVGRDYAYLIQFAGDALPTVTAYDHTQMVKPTGWRTPIVGFIGAAL